MRDFDLNPLIVRLEWTHGHNRHKVTLVINRKLRSYAIGQRSTGVWVLAVRYFDGNDTVIEVSSPLAAGIVEKAYAAIDAAVTGVVADSSAAPVEEPKELEKSAGWSEEKKQSVGKQMLLAEERARMRATARTSKSSKSTPVPHNW